MGTPSIPGNGGQVSEKTGRPAGRAAGTAQKAAGAAKGTARRTAHGTADSVREGAGQVGDHVTALPGRVAGLARLVTLGRLLRAAPVAAAAVAGVAVGRLTARKR